jgi:diguanylate cyclase (GGDEF)-like protein
MMHEDLPRKLATVIGCGSVALGSVVLVGGWFLGFDPLKGVIPGASPMKPDTALILVLLGASLTIVENHRGALRLGDVLAVLAIGLGVASLAESAWHLDLRIDALLTMGSSNSQAALADRTAPSTALAAALLGVALLGTRRSAAHLVKIAGASGAVLIAWAALSSYVFGPDVMHAVPFFGFMALHTAAIIFFLGIGVLAAAPVSWPISTMLSNGVGGIISRWLLPAAVLAPPAVGWFLTRQGMLDVFPIQFDWALYSVITSVGSVILILFLTRRIELIDAERSVVRELARHDPLTGLANRRALDSILTESFNLAKRYDRPLSLMMLDIDHFKTYNDEYGHPAGDALLKDLGGLISRPARRTDLVARIGGEEFAIVLPETGLSGARSLAEDLRSAVEHSTLFRRGITVSIGIATVSPRTATVAELVSECDAALYRAKASGRNRICLGSEMAESVGLPS